MNPAKPKRMIVGVHSASLGMVYAEALVMLGVERGWVVCGVEGLDEISPAGETDIWDINHSVITHRTISPSTFNLPCHPLSQVVGGTPSQNASILTDLLNNKLPTDDAIENFVVMNAAALLLVSGKCETELEGVTIARESISSGKAKEALEIFRREATECCAE